MTTQTPNTAEIYSSHIPALNVLMNMGWEYLSYTQCLKMRGGNNHVVLNNILVAELKKRRFSYKGQEYPLSNNAISQIVRDLTAPSLNEGLASANEKLYHAITLGITVTEFVDGKKYSPTIAIIDWKNVDNNSFIITDELEVLRADGIQTRRPDMVLYVNGLPLGVIEAKRPDSGNPNKSMLDEGISQNIRNQKLDEIPHLFVYSQLLMSINGTDGRYGTTKTAKKFWAKWHEEELTENDFFKIKNTPLHDLQKNKLLQERPPYIQNYFKTLWQQEQLVTDQDRLLISLLSKERFLEFIRYYILFDRKNGKIVARYQQAFGIKALIKRIITIRPDGGREGGVIWHTTGSGKSFTMVFLCKALLLHEELSECRIIAVTDRIDLEKQLAKTFLTGGAFGIGGTGGKDEENKYKASTGRDLAQKIATGNERIIFSIINKFSTAAKLPECYNPSSNIIVLIDEGHRSHGSETHERMKKSLPNASYIAFTGTPLLKDDKTTNKFGSIIHAYTMQNATQDGTVTPLLYEERKPILDINDKVIDNWFDKITADLSDKQKSDLKDKFSKRGQVYGSAGRIELIAWDIASHFKENFKDLAKDLKGQLATDSKLSAIRYKKSLDSTGFVSSAVIISPPDTREGHDNVDETELPEVQEWWKRNITGSVEEYERKTIEDFSEAGDPDILIVVDKLLTGFDEPKNAVLYIDKPLKEHNLIQAIARVNRLHEQKKYGLLIDYRGILKQLDTAIKEYQNLAEKTQGGFDIDDIEGLYQNVSTEYKRLPVLHETLWNLFSSVKNRSDLEQYRQLLIPKYQTSTCGDMIDANQKHREDFYEALTEFGLCLKIALGTHSFFEDKSITEEQIERYKQDLNFFTNLRKITRQDAEETVDFSIYENQIRKLVDKHVIGEEIKDSKGVYIVNDLGGEDAEKWSEEKLRNETDIIKSRLRKTIEQDLADDPYAKMYFSELLKRAIAEAEELFAHPFKQYSLFNDLENKTKTREVTGIPQVLKHNKQASAYYGILKIILEKNEDAFKEKILIDICFTIDIFVQNALAEHSLNQQDIEANIRKDILPILFKAIGLEDAKKAVEGIIGIVRIELSRQNI
jgi:type I restriction enzyme, R subunit